LITAWGETVIRFSQLRSRNAKSQSQSKTRLSTSLLYGLPLTATHLTYRKAQPGDLEAIRALVRTEHLNPKDLNWRYFVVATFEDHMVGAAQLRRRADGSRELASFVVTAPLRHLGIGACLLDTLLKHEVRTVYIVTRHSVATYFKRWGFAKVSLTEVPADVRHNRLIGGMFSLLLGLLGYRAERLVVVKRPQVQENVVLQFQPRAAGLPTNTL
jgi:amino-acid N-acetyltransferase